MGKKRNIIVGQSGGPTSVINSSLAGVYKTAESAAFIRFTECCMGSRAFWMSSM